MTVSEGKLGYLGRIVGLAAWAVRQLRRYTAFVPYTEVVVSDAAVVLVVSNPVLHEDLAAWVLEMGMYRVRWRVGAEFLESVRGVLATEGLTGDWADMDRPAVPQLTHTADVEIVKPEGRSVDSLGPREH